MGPNTTVQHVVNGGGLGVGVEQAIEALSTATGHPLPPIVLHSVVIAVAAVWCWLVPHAADKAPAVTA